MVDRNMKRNTTFTNSLTEEKKVSVIIPNYNKAKFIKACVNSIITQSYDNIEIVIVDDCSTDNSREIISELQKSTNTIKTIFLDKNVGVCIARNIGAKNATGQCITFLDSDDVYVNNMKIENEVNLIKKQNDIAFSQWVKLDVNGEITSDNIIYKNVYNNRYAISKILSLSRPLYQQLRGYMFTKKLFEKVGGYTFPYNYCEDFDFQCRLVLNGKLKYTKEYGEGYRNVPKGLSKNTEIDGEYIVSLIQKEYFKKLSFDQKLYYKYLLINKRKLLKALLTRLHLYNNVSS